MADPTSPDRLAGTAVLVAVAWPYASGSRHLGHLAGAYLPADVYARHQRLVGNRVLMVSGSDVHGTPITVRADAEGVTPTDIVERYHAEFVADWERLGISWDLYTSTGTENHAEVTQDLFLRLLENGHIDRRSSEQYFDAEADRFLPDRYIEGTCPHCDYAEARGDQCEDCGRTLDPEELVDPRSKITGSIPELRPTEHFYLRLSNFTEPLGEWLNSREGWRRHVLNFSKGWVEEGLQDRAITRDLDWGIELPVDDLGPGKRIYVWFEAVIGYLSAAKEWAQRRGDPEAWRDWWEDPKARTVYFIGKDNIPFHTIIWPGMLIGYGGLNLPTDVPANQYVTFKGGKASASRGVGLTIGEGLNLFQADALRYALAASLPEQSDTDLSVDEIGRRINEELVATWGNLVNRVLSMVHKNCDATVPSPDGRTVDDHAVLAAIDAALVAVTDQVERVELRAALRTGMEAAADVNAYLNATEPWKLAKSDPDRARVVLGTALAAVAGVRVALSPYLPSSTAALDDVFGQIEAWERVEPVPGTPVLKPTPLFAKVDLDELLIDEVPADGTDG
ncbi:MAG: methionine--tRNA ligase [Actinomycetota bacterium]|nr:methionine--tRNA ligase [Actinomycetota bacterium]MEC9467158.1 methionine--tRNA ligase [Actinomycetota bacterium]MED6328527.1 methionine--tRNA ligase [Actinomycetota bacterium]MEE2958108.1 methionine--tRNA ligase [Actinomycetota bacterium]